MGWAGTTLDARRDERRRLLLEVGLDLLGGEGSGAVTVRSVCRHAKLTDRYFYENFADRDELMLTVFDQVAAEARDALVAATAEVATAPVGVPAPADRLARRAVERFLAVLVDDPRKGRVLLLEPLTDATLSRRAVEVLPLFAALVRSQLGVTTTALDAEMTATALIGALANLFGRWLEGDLKASRQEVTDFGVHLLTNLAMPPRG
ncbi:MAG: TetR/AcrR family transcriptional regulator [Actinomycetota bacterium]|nr:TetR/AcrR family transcriptional regulator [Actinomycetota bacterium]